MDLVRTLLEAQHPDLAALPVQAVEGGWDNALFRLGTDRCVRLPRRSIAAPLVHHEQRWLPELAGRLPLPVPVVERRGRPGAGYPWAWSVLPWLAGEPADRDPPAVGEAPRWGHFLRALHRPAPAEAPHNPFRGVALANRADSIEERLHRRRGELARLERDAGMAAGCLQDLWQASRQAPVDDRRRWLHGDLHARNVLVTGGRFSAVIDWGDLCGGDAATDLASLWHLFDGAAVRLEAAAHSGSRDEAVWQRAAGWALVVGLVLFDSGLADNARHARMGAQTLNRLLAGPDAAALALRSAAGPPLD